MTIREYSPADRRACVEIFKSNQSPYFDPSEAEDLEKFLDSRDNNVIGYKNTHLMRFYVGVLNNQVVGCGGYYIPTEELRAIMVWGMVNRKLHGYGYGKKLLEFRIAEVRKQHPGHQILLDTTQHTYQFFEKQGFVVTKVTNNYYGDGLHRYDMTDWVEVRKMAGTLSGNIAEEKITNQAAYWNRVAGSKNFTHPFNIRLIEGYVEKDSSIVDFGCGYGRVVAGLQEKGFTHVRGFDTSLELIKRGHQDGVRDIFLMNPNAGMEIEDHSIACVLLFAVLTCIPDNRSQQNVINMLYSKLKPGGILYLSDYYLQTEMREATEYSYWNDDQDNYGVFTLPEGPSFRHHTREWIRVLLKDFTIKEELAIEVNTMNGHKATAFQLIAQK